MRPRLILTTTFALLCSILFGQNAILKGNVTDKDGLPVPGVNIFIAPDDIRGNTNDMGDYRIIVPANERIKVVFSFLGNTKSFDLLFTEGEERVLNTNISLDFEVGTATVEGMGERQRPMISIDPRVANYIPSPRGGIEDVLIQAPVNFSSELSSSYSVRGGSFDENLVYVNDIQVYRPFLVRAGQQEGLSFPNPDMVDNIEFSAGGFEAKYGDRMSSVLDLKYRKPQDFRGAVSGSLLGGSLQLEDLSKNGKFSHNSGFRYRNNSYVLGSLDTQGDYNPSYMDFQTYLTYQAKGNLSFNFLGNYARNRYNFIPQTRETNIGTINEALRLTIFFDGQEISQFETGFGAVSMNYQPTELSMLKFIVSGFQTYEQENFDIQGQYFLDELEQDLGNDDFGNVVSNRGVGSFLEHARNDLEARVTAITHKGYNDFDASNHYLQWGLTFQTETITDRLSEWTLVDSAGYASPRPPDSLGYTNPGLQGSRTLELQDVIKAQNELQSNRLMAYVQDSYDWETENGDKFTANLGIRGQYWDFNNETVISPRANFSYTPIWNVVKKDKKNRADTTFQRDIVFTAAGGYYYQPPFYREMRGLDGKINQDIRAQRSIHAVVGANYIFNAWGRPFKMNAEAYYKDYKRLIPYEVENVRLRYFAENSAVGYAYGADVMVNGEFIKGVQSWFRASYLRTEEDLLNDEYYEYYNAEGERIIPGYTFDQNVADSARFVPGYIPRPTDQRFTFAMFFQDEMPRWPDFKVQIRLYYGTGLPYGPPDFQRYKDILRTTSYRRVDVGFSKVLIDPNKENTKRIAKIFKEAMLSVEVFNLLGINNTINHTWIEDVNGNNYAIPNFLTGRRINVKLFAKF
jgi:hypothetical protein